MELENIILKAVDAYKEACQGAYPREKSWDLCHNSFCKLLENFNDEEQKRNMAIELAAYMASYGMYRNSFLLNVNYLVFEEIIDILLEPKYRTLITLDDESKVDVIFELKQDIFLRLNEVKIQGKSNRGITDTLISKILLGTYGCTVAYDYRIKRSLSELNKMGLVNKTSFCPESIKELLKLCEQYNIDSCIEEDNLTLMRKLDIVLWFAEWN